MDEMRRSYKQENIYPGNNTCTITKGCEGHSGYIAA